MIDAEKCTSKDKKFKLSELNELIWHPNKSFNGFFSPVTGPCMFTPQSHFLPRTDDKHVHRRGRALSAEAFVALKRKKDVGLFL